MLRRLVVGLVALVVLGLPAVAGAEVSHPFLASFDGSGTPAGSFGQADGVAVDGATGDVYVADIANNVIDKFTAAGAYLCQVTGSSVPSASECDGITGSATAAGSFSLAHPAALAVDNSGGPDAGDLYVTDIGHGVVDKFSPSGEYLGEVGGGFAELRGVGVDGAGNVWVYTAEPPTMDEFDLTGSLIFQFHPAFAVAEPAFAVDAGGDTYPTRISGVEKYDSSGTAVELLEACISCSTVGVTTDLSTDDVYIDDGSSVVEYDAAANLQAQFGVPQLGSGGSGGIGVDPVSGTVYVANAADGKVYVFGPAPGPRVTTGSAKSVTTTGATLEGTVDPEGSDTTYQFEYGTTTSYGQVVPVPAVDAGAGTSPVPASAAVTGLQGGTVYHYRVVASNANGTVSGADRVFTTLPVPVIDGASITGLGASSAVLNARVDPEGLDTTYHFEWGASTAYGTVVPVPDGDIGAGTSDVALTQPIAGLSANTTYHWRVVAKNANGTVVGVDHSFVYDTAGPRLPDNRAYEMVTPARKNGSLIGDVFVAGNAPQISADGSRVFTSTIQCFADAASCQANRKFVGSPYAFTRTNGGWQTTALSLPATQFDIDTTWNYSADLDTAILSAPTPGDQEEDLYGRRADGSLIDIGPLRPPSANRAVVPGIVAGHATADLSRFVWQQVIYSERIWPFDLTALNGVESIYEYVGAGNSEPLLVGVSGGPGSRDLISTCGTTLGGSGVAPGSMSADGRTVYFTVQPCSSGSGANSEKPVLAYAVYARVDESRTVAISGRSPDECTGICQASPLADAELYGASEDGSKAFFASTQQLTDTASEDNHGEDSAHSSGCAETTGVNGCNLYEYDFSRPAGRELVDVSAGDSSGGGPRVRGVMAMAPDGSHVYFVAQGVLSGNANGAGQVARDGADNLYVYERDARYPQGRVVFIASLSSADSQEWPAGGFKHVASVTPDGRYLVFLSHAQLTADDTSLSGAAQVFRYDAQTGELLRISVGEEGFNDNGNRSAATPCFIDLTCSEDADLAHPNFVSLSPGRSDPTMSHDGAYVFFQSPVALAPGALDDVRTGATSATDGGAVYAQNVYEWHAGHVYLISDGRDASANAGRSGICGTESSVCLLGADATGANVFFTTADRLVPADTDTELDYYDARICTAGDPCINPSVAPAGCLGEACRGVSGAPPVFGAPASSVLSGAGNLAAPARPAVKTKKKVKRKAKPRKPKKARHKRARKAARTGKHVKRARG